MISVRTMDQEVSDEDYFAKPAVAETLCESGNPDSLRTRVQAPTPALPRDRASGPPSHPA
jgi:hypothetical protein